MTEPVIQVTDLVKRHGAGKSATIKVLGTLADPASGSARVAGPDARMKPGDAARR